MPTYEYECSHCLARFEIKQAFADDSKVICHHCGGETRRIFSPVPIIFKGPGFYCTDNPRNSYQTWNKDESGDKKIDEEAVEAGRQ